MSLKFGQAESIGNFEHLVIHFWTVWPRISYFSVLRLGFLFSKCGQYLIPTSQHSEDWLKSFAENLGSLFPQGLDGYPVMESVRIHVSSYPYTLSPGRLWEVTHPDVWKVLLNLQNESEAFPTLCAWEPFPAPRDISKAGLVNLFSAAKKMDLKVQ